MAEQSKLDQEREELKRQLAVGTYQTSIDLMLDGTGRFIQKLTRGSKPPSFWYSAIILILFPLLISLLISFLLGEINNLIPEPLLVQIIVSGMMFVIMILVKIYLDSVFSAWQNYFLDAIESEDDIIDFQHWISTLCDIKKQLVFGIVYSVIVGLYGLAWVSASIGWGGFGFALFLLYLTFFAGIHIYYFFLFIIFPLRLSRYHFKLYDADPRNSEVIYRLSSQLSTFVYIMALSLALVTLLAGSWNLLEQPLFVIPFVLIMWVPLTILFIFNQYGLTKIINRTKWEKLNKVQAEIETLEEENNIVDKGTMEAVNRLMDFHDRIKSTRNSALDLRAGLNFANSLLLPFIAFVLGNWDKIVVLFS